MDAFALAGLLVLPVWVVWLARPRSTVALTLASTPWIVGPPALVYAVRAAPALVELAPMVLMPEELTIRAALATDLGTDLAWAHFCALDLLAGQIVLRDSLARDASALRVRLSLLLTLAFAPLGLLVHLITRDLYIRPMIQEPDPIVRPEAPR
jgi:hypothetical protein